MTFDGKRRLILRDSSRNGTTVSYGNEAQKRTDFSSILDIYKDSGDEPRDVVVQVRELRFMIEFPNHEKCQNKSNDNVDSFLRKGRANVPALNALTTNTPQKTAIAGENPSCNESTI